MPQVAPKNPVMQEFGEGRVWITPSKSRAGYNHVTILQTGGEIICTCEGAKFAKKCWHENSIRDLIGDTDDFQVNM